jgi:proteasome activator-like protein
MLQAMTDDAPQSPLVEVVEGRDGEPPEREVVTEPAKLIRIASMVRNMLEEVRHAPLDEAGRRRLRDVHDRSISGLEEILSPDLREELAEVFLPFTDAAPSESELRLTQAQLVGWLEGLFHGIQASLMSQQMATQAQIEQMRKQRALNPASPHQAPTERGSGYL